MMKSVRQFAIALVIGGAFTAPAIAQTGYQTSRFAQPAMLPEYSGAPQVQPEILPTSGGYLSVARRGNGPEVIDGPVPAPAPAHSVITSPSDVQPLPTMPAQTMGAPCATGNCDNGYGSSGVYADGGYGGCYGEGCYADGGYGYGCGVPAWQVYVGAVFMSRDSANKKWTTYETNNNPNQLMYYPDNDWGAGPELSITKSIGCDGTRGIQGVYYGIAGMDGYDSRYSSANLLSSPINLGFVDYNTQGNPASSFFDNSREHRVWRDNEFHNVEINYIHYLYGNSCNTCSPFNFAWLSGFRFIKFDDDLTFGAVSSGNEFGVNGVNEAYFTSNVSNSLYGWQIGALMQHNLNCKWSWYASPKVGIFANQIDFDTCGYRGDGARAVFSATGNQFDLRNSKTDIAMVGQIDLGVNYRLNNCWTLTGGYRVLGITGLALADDQVPAYLAAEGDWTDIESSGAAIFHGAFFGVTRTW